MTAASAARLAVAVLGLGCKLHAPGFARDAGSARADVGAVLASGRPGDLPGAMARGPHGPWRYDGAGGAAVSPAVYLGGAVYSALAVPAEDLAHAELRWVRWSDGGAEVVDRRQVTGMIPGAALALVPRAGGYTLVWLPARAQDAARAADVEARGFVGEERAAGAPEAEGAAWIAGVMARRAREHADEPAPAVTRAAATARVETRRGQLVALVDNLEVTRGPDLLGYERALGVGGTPGGVRWVALSRGQCGEARVEVYRVAGGVVALRGGFAIGTEVGVRWIAIEARDGVAAVTWYQDYVPLRIECARGPRGAQVRDLGVRVALVPDEA